MEIEVLEGAILDAPSAAFAQAAKADAKIALSIDEAVEQARQSRAIMFEAIKASLSLALQGLPKEWENLVGNGFPITNKGTLKTLLSAKTADGKALKSLLTSPKSGYRVKSSIFTESVKIEEAKATVSGLLNPFEVHVKRAPKGEVDKMIGDLTRIANRLKTISPADSLMADNISRYISFYKDMLSADKDLGND